MIQLRGKRVEDWPTNRAPTRRTACVRWILVGCGVFVGGLVTTACESGESDPEGAEVASAKDAVSGDSQNVSDTTDTYTPGGAPLGESYYLLEVTTSEGEQLIFDRDLTLNGSAFSFGSTHLAPPALTLAVNDTLYEPTFMVVEINFGFLIGNADHTVTTPDAGEYPFKAIPPYIELEIPDLAALYSSKPGLATGKFEITDYSQEPGGIFAGTITGTLVESKLDPNRTAQITVDFHFVLPKTTDGGN